MMRIGENRAVDRGVLERVDRFEDELLLVEDDADVHARVALLDLVDLAYTPDRRCNDVCVGLRVRSRRRSRVAVEAFERALLLNGVGDFRDVAMRTGAPFLTVKTRFEICSRIAAGRCADLNSLGPT